VKNIGTTSDKPSIGGEMEVDLSSLLGPAPIDSVHARLLLRRGTVMTGRTAVKWALNAIKPSRPFLLPGYLCAGLLQPFKELNVAVAYYRIREDLSIDLDDLSRQVETVRPSGVLFINYFGFPVGREAANVLRRLAGRCWVIEDCAHGSLIETPRPVVGRIGHFIVTSFRKYFPVPDGGLLINRRGLPFPELPAATAADGFVRRRLLGKLLRQEAVSNGGSPELEQSFLTLFSLAERELDMATPMLSMSMTSRRMVESMEVKSAMEKRRKNFRFLLGRFKNSASLRSLASPIYSRLPAGVSPLLFPIRVKGGRRDALRRALAVKRIYCPVHWPLPREVKASWSPELRRLSGDILGLPVDQRYGRKSMESLVDRFLRAGGLP
jgi:hypothetical protein